MSPPKSRLARTHVHLGRWRRRRVSARCHGRAPGLVRVAVPRTARLPHDVSHATDPDRSRATRVYVLGRTVVPVLESRPSALHLILGTHPAFPRDDSLKPKRATRCSPPPPTDLRPSRSYRLQPNPPPLLHILGLDTCARSGSTRSVSVPNLRDAAGAHHPPARSASLLLIDTVASVPVARLRPSAGRLGMATPDPHVKYGAGARATALVPDDFAVRAAPVKKRHSFFGRPESMSSLHSPSSSRLAPSPSVQGVLYHDLPDRPSLDLGRRRQQSDPPPEARRRSFFNGRWRLHKPARPDPPCNDEPAPVAEPTNTADSPPDTMARPRAVFTNEDECTSPPFHVPPQPRADQLTRDHPRLSPPHQADHLASVQFQARRTHPQETPARPRLCR